MKSFLKRLFLHFGYNVAKIGNDVSVYRELYGNDVVDVKPFYNVGAGNFNHPCWTNVDHKSGWYACEQHKAFVEWDLFSLKPIPLEDGSAEIVYSSHTIEHINDDAAKNFFREAYRILKPHGVLRVTCPNVDLAYRAYKESDDGFFPVPTDDWRTIGLARSFGDISLGQLFLLFFASVASVAHVADAEKISDSELCELFRNRGFEEALNYCVAKCSVELQNKFVGAHMNWWNPAKLVRMLETAGFREVRVSAFGQSHVHVLRNTRFFDCTGPGISLYVEASK